MGVGFGTMAGVGGAVGGVVGSAVNNAMNSVSQSTQNEQQNQSQAQNDTDTFKLKLEKLTAMKETGVISEEEYNQMKAKLISEIMG